MFRSVLALALVLSTAALAQTYSPSEIVRGLCQPDGCDEFTILSAQQIAGGQDGTLLKTRVRTFHASSAGRQERGEEDGYVYCSRTKPTIMAERAGRTMALYIAPFATADSRETIRQNANFHAIYFSVCHSTEAGRAAVHNLPGIAQSLGYHVALAQSKREPLNRPHDILTSSKSMSAEASLDHSMQRRSEQLTPPGAIPPASMGSVEVQPAPLRQAPPTGVQEDSGIMAGPRQLTNRAFDALDQVGNWVRGR
jgi:hypothetical protein